MKFLLKHLFEKVAEKLHAAKKEDWNGRRKGIVRPELLSKEERAELIRRNPSYGTIICRCENVSEGEIVDAINRTLGAKSLDGISAACVRAWDAVRLASAHREPWKFFQENLESAWKRSARMHRDLKC